MGGQFSNCAMVVVCTLILPSDYDDQLEDEDYDLIAENTGIQLQRKKFRRVHGNVLDSDEEEGEGEESAAPAGANTSFTRDESMDSTQDEDFAHVSWSYSGLATHF